MRNAREELSEIWRACFDRPLREPRERADALQAWSDRRSEHLELTLEIMCEAMESPRYTAVGGRPEEGSHPVLILMTGYSEEQLALVIAAHASRGKCSTVVPVTSVRVWSTIQGTVRDCLQILGVGVEADLLSDPLFVDPSDPVDVFRAILNWLRESPGRPVAVDCTGGQKPMDTGAAHAASFYGVPAYYLNFDEYDPDLRRPLPWTCRYHELPLPDAVFSLAGRQRAFSAYRSRRFAEAHSALTDIVNDAKKSTFFEPGDIHDLERAERLLDVASAWLNVRYDTPLLAGSPLHGHFVTLKESSDVRRVVETLLDPKQIDVLFRYIVEEYWRLELLFEGAAYREALVCAVGLAELTVDALFHLPWFGKNRIVSARAVAWERPNVDPLPDLPDLTGWEDSAVPTASLPPSAFRAKTKLLYKGESVFSVWAHPARSTAELRAPRLMDKDPRLIAEVTVKAPALLSGSNREWDEAFKFPNGSWVQTRNALVHLRAPLFSPDLPKRALEVYVPRLIEVLHRAHKNQPLNLGSVASASWVTWKDKSGFQREDCAPWIEKHAESEMSRWLRLTP